MVTPDRGRLFALLNELPAIVYLKAPDYTIRFANRRFRTHFGDPESDLCYRLIHGRETPCEHCPNPTVLRDHQPVEWEWSLADGAHFQVYDYPFVDLDGTELVLQLGIDVTERKQAEVERERANQELLDLSRVEREARLYAEALAEAALALSESLELDQVLDRILEQTQRVIPSFGAAVILAEGDKLHLARHRGLEQHPETLALFQSGVSLDALPFLQEVCVVRRAVQVDDTHLGPVRWGARVLEWVRSLVAAPLVEGQDLVGLIALFSPERRFFDRTSSSRLQAFATHAVLAIQNARLYEEARAGREQLQVLSRRLVEVQETERRAIARELHDEAGQALTSLMVGLKLLQRQASQPEAVQEEVRGLMSTVEGVMENLHRLAIDLRPASLDHLGLVPAVRRHCEALNEQHGLSVHFEVFGLEGRLPNGAETALYRIVQEALTNVVRHACATSVDVILERRDDNVIAIIEDNGQGFEVAMAKGSEMLGLVGIRERAEALGGTLFVESSPGGGTTVVVEVPYVDSDPDR